MFFLRHFCRHTRREVRIEKPNSFFASWFDAFEAVLPNIRRVESQGLSQGAAPDGGKRNLPRKS